MLINAVKEFNKKAAEKLQMKLSTVQGIKQEESTVVIKLTVHLEAPKYIVPIASCDGNHHVQNHFTDCKAILWLNPIQTVNRETSLALPYKMELHKTNKPCKLRSTCYFSISVQFKPYSEHVYHQVKDGDGFCIHEGNDSSSFWLFFHKPQARYIVDLHLLFIIDECGKEFPFQRKECSLFFQSTEPKLTVPTSCNTVEKLPGFSRDGIYQRITDSLRKRVLKGMSEHEVSQLSKLISISSCLEIDDDMKVITFLHLGFHHQMIMNRSDSKESFAKSKDMLEMAVEICNQGSCRNKWFLIGRANIFFAQNFYYAENFDLAEAYLEKADYYFFLLPNRHEKSGLIYQHVLLRSISELNGRELSDETITELGHLMQLAVSYAFLGNTYESECMKAFMLVKNAMLYLGIFNLTHSKYIGRKLQDYIVKPRFLQKAKECLDGIPKDIVSTENNVVSYYKGLYLFTLSEYLRHDKEYIKSLQSLNEAELQLKQCKFRFPQKEIEKRRDFLLEAISTDDMNEAVRLINDRM